MFVKTYGKQKKEGLFEEMKNVKDFGKQGLFLIPPKGNLLKETFAILCRYLCPFYIDLWGRRHYKNKLIHPCPDQWHPLRHSRLQLNPANIYRGPPMRSGHLGYIGEQNRRMLALKASGLGGVRMSPPRLLSELAR